MSGWSERASLLLGRGITLGNLSDHLASVHGDRPLVEEAAESGLRLSYREAAERVGRMAATVAARAGAGDRVVLALPNRYDLVLSALAVSRAGAVPVPLNSELRDSEIELVAADAGATWVVRSSQELLGPEGVPPAFPPAAAVPANPADVAAIFYTSGTTGRPKGVRLTHRSLLGQTRATALYPVRLREDEAVLGLPLSHIMGFVAVLSMAVAGIPVYFLPHFRPDEVLDAIEDRGATIFVGVPAMYRLMDEAGAGERNLKSVRLWASGADTMPPELARKFQRMGASLTLPGLGIPVGEAAFIEGYGMVETGGGVAVKMSLPWLRLLPGDSVGIPLPPYRFRVVGPDGLDVPTGQVGELWVKGPGVLEGYHGDDDATREVLTADGWLRTGDMARRGAFGMVHFAGREKDVIKRGGYSVYAVEVEGVLEGHPAVVEAAVVGLPDDRLGEVPAAAVRLAPGQEVSESALTEWAVEHLAPYKVPSRILVVSDLPRTGTRKVRRAEVRQLFADQPGD